MVRCDQRVWTEVEELLLRARDPLSAQPGVNLAHLAPALFIHWGHPRRRTGMGIYVEQPHYADPWYVLSFTPLALMLTTLIGARNRSPRDMFFFSCYEDGLRGLVPRPLPDEPVQDITQYGVDWEVNNNPAVMNHLLAHNPQEWDNDNPFHSAAHGGPSQFSYVECDAPGCPLYIHEVQELHMRLSATVDLQSKHMMVRRMVWENALAICGEILVRPGRVARV